MTAMQSIPATLLVAIDILKHLHEVLIGSREWQTFLRQHGLDMSDTEFARA